MALAQPHIHLLKSLRNAGMIGPNKSQAVLELGEQNWYGDVDPQALQTLIDTWYHEEPLGTELNSQLQGLLLQARSDSWFFAVAKVFYRIVFGPHHYRAVDLHGTDVAERHDLNQPLPFEEQFDVVTNFGTTEHVFNQYQVFRTIHDHTLPGGLMIHSLPNQGSYDHGFFNYHPTFVFDLCEANAYRIIVLAYYDVTNPAVTQIHDRADYVRMALAGQLSNQSALLTALCKSDAPAPFASPMQGYYNNSLPQELREAWLRLPR